MENLNIMEDAQPKDEENTGYIEIEMPYHLYQYLSSEQCNLQAVCRICLSTSNDIMYSLISTKETSVLADMFMTITSIQFQAEDGLPSSICESCQIQVVQSYEFKLKCEKSDYMLKSVLRGEFVVKDEHSSNITIDNIVKDEINNGENELKNEDMPYLEELCDNADQCFQNIAQNTRKRKRKKLKGCVTDSKSLLKEVISENLTDKKKSKPYKCLYCSKKFSKSKAYRAHVKNKHENENCPHPCEQCRESFKSEHDLHIHSALHVKGIWKCNKCDKVYNAKFRLRRHIKRHMDSKRYTCDSCGKAFTELYALRRHLRVHTGEFVEKKHACHICDKRYGSQGLLAAHVAGHGGARPCRCGTCGKAFPSPRLLASHRLVHSDHKPYACTYCDKRFRHESTRNTHHRTHTGEKPYVCSVCGKCFIQNSNLTLHMRTHTGERPYSCSQCDKKFTSGSSLKSHQRIHTGERPYSCNICGKRFARLNLSSHMRQHTGERPYACNICSKKFTKATLLRDHHRQHTGEKPFECAQCPHKFATKTHLVKHTKLHQKRKKNEKRDRVIEEQVNCNQQIVTDKIVCKDGQIDNATESNSENITVETVQTVLEDTIEVTREFEDRYLKTEYLVIDNNNFQNNSICLNNTNNVDIISSGVNYGSDVNLVTVNEGEVSISTGGLEGTTVKLYQLDQSLVQIHSAAGQVTISKITSKMTANF